MIKVPHYCQYPHPFAYPEGNTTPFEQWYFNSFKPEDEREREYLPIFWTGGYVLHNYGADKGYIQRVQSFLDTLDKSKRYYTLLQYDDGILNDISGLDIKVYASSGPRVDYALPLLCKPHPYQFPETKTIFCSFVGRITHDIRLQIIKELTGKEGYVISTNKHRTYDYCRILAASKFVLCPRGYGWNSFRIAEALQYGAMPVIISDEWREPTDAFVDFTCVEILQMQVFDIDRILKHIERYSGSTMAEAAKKCYEKYFTFEANKKFILDDLKNESNP